MLSKLLIKNIALIDEEEILFGEGLNVLSGETGAGKSVILDSVNFVLGAKADKSMIRHGETECFVKAEFCVSETSIAVEVLKELDIESDGNIIVSRRYNADGKGSIKINGNTVTVGMLKKLTDALVDVHGQSEHFYLLSESNQLKTLDAVAKDTLAPLKDKLCELLKTLDDTKERLKMLGGSEEERERRLDILSFQIDEIENVGLKAGEEEELSAKKIKITNLEKIINSLKEVSECLNSESGALEMVRQAKRSLSGIARLDEEYENLLSRLDSLSIDTEDILETSNNVIDGLYFDENDANEVEIRLDTIKALKRKYGATKEEIDETLKQFKTEYELLSDSAGQFVYLSDKIEKLKKDCYDVCNKITKIRKDVASDFSQKIESELKTLNIPSAKFEVAFENYSLEDIDRATKDGLDKVSFQFSANAGEPVKELSKIISGGEMSRFMLALKTCLSDLNGISTYIFDEIDAGISGKTAKVVGEKFAKISRNKQIIAVSHLPQIACMSDVEFLIEKQEKGGKTYSTIQRLTKEEKIKELVRLIGGEENETHATKHAEEMLRQAEEYKDSL